ncbi:MAG TPA: type ISP restriction/modification enzyme [Pyrinomonadaceae bacterium]|jgi:predicted helicase|nr:type ISP restriction/modification enzyme [Pyrinomonadaceae bacterium]
MTKARIFHARVDEFWRKGQKYNYLNEGQSVGNIEWQEIQPDAKHNWMTEGMHDDYATFLPIGTKEARQGKSLNPETIFKLFSTGLMTGRDAIVYDFNRDHLLKRIEQFCDEYNGEVSRYQQKGKPKDIDSFLKYDRIKWSRNLKRDLQNDKLITVNESNLRIGAYRPFTKQHLYFADSIVDELGKNKNFFPTIGTEKENRLICITSPGSEKPFVAILSNNIPDLHLSSPGTGAQGFPFYTYDEDGTNRRENITDWALEKFRAEYADESITKWDIFYYVYAVLHHPFYRERYAANLKRELPRIPFAPDFRAFAEAGARLADIHVNYERQPEYPLERIENPEARLDWRVLKMRLGKDRSHIIYNDFLTLARVPTEAFEYRLGNRSALDWVIDQYRVTTDKRSGITNDPNRPDDPQYIVRLVAQVITVSLETVRLVQSLPDMGISTA